MVLLRNDSFDGRYEAPDVGLVQKIAVPDVVLHLAILLNCLCELFAVHVLLLLLLVHEFIRKQDSLGLALSNSHITSFLNSMLIIPFSARFPKRTPILACGICWIS